MLVVEQVLIHQGHFLRVLLSHAADGLLLLLQLLLVLARMAAQHCAAVLLLLKQRLQLPVLDVQLLAPLLVELLLGGNDGVLLELGLVEPALVLVFVDFGGD